MSLDIRDPKTTLRLEAALRLMVKVGNVSCAYVARRYNLDAEDLKAWLDAFNGGARELTEARIEAVKVELGLVSTGRAPAAVPTMAVESVASATEPAGGKSGLAAQVAAAAEPSAGGRGSMRPRCIEICRRLLADPKLSEKRAYTELGVLAGSWCFFKKREFGMGPIAREKLVLFLAKIDRADKAVPAVDSARNEKADERVAPPARARVLPPGKWPSVLPAVRLEITGKERRHLVASVLCGLLANPANVRREVGELEDQAWGFVNRLIARDAEKGGAE